MAAYGILITHVAFQTGTDSPLLERFDYFVAVFFVLSAFLLARGAPTPGFYSRRLARLAPAYLVCVVTLLLCLPPLSKVTPAQVAANLLLIQLYVPDGLIDGLTQMWSLCVEAAFYLVLPAYLRLGTRGRWATLAAAVPLGLVWPHLAQLIDARANALDAGLNLQIWPFSYAPWFAVGLACAELERAGVRYGGPRWPYPLAALAVAYAAGVAGPRGLTHPTAWEFNARVILGTAFAALMVAPFALGPRERGTLLSSAPMRCLGRWSYSLFLWHVGALYFAFPILGLELFDAPFVPILAATAALSTAVAYVSYELVEVPGARLLRRLTAGVGSRRAAGHARHATAKHPAKTRKAEEPA